jgi:hypothetical protein
MIYCVIPRELADELYDKMVEYYKDNPNVTVIVDRREGGDRRNRRGAPPSDDRRSPNQFRDRRRERLPGTFPETDAPDTD